MAKLRVLTVALLLSATGAGAWAGPSLMGASGGLTLPNTQVVPEGTLVGSGSILWVDRAGSTQSNDWYTLTYGIMHNLEVGVSRVTYRTRPSRTWLFQAKYHLLPQQGIWPSLAAGTLDITNDLGLRQATAYVVAGRNLWASIDQFTGDPVNPLQGYVGYGSGIYGSSLFGGLDWQLRRNARLMVEYAKNHALGPGGHLFNLGAEVALGKGFKVTGGVLDMRHPSIGVSYQLDTRSF